MAQAYPTYIFRAFDCVGWISVSAIHRQDAVLHAQKLLKMMGYGV